MASVIRDCPIWKRPKAIAAYLQQARVPRSAGLTLVSARFVGIKPGAGWCGSRSSVARAETRDPDMVIREPARGIRGCVFLYLEMPFQDGSASFQNCETMRVSRA